MINDIIDILKNVFLRHKGVRTFKYQGSIYNNAQPNDNVYSVFIDDIVFSELLITNHIFTMNFEIYILGFPTDEKPVIEVQDDAFTIACDVLNYIDLSKEYQGVLSVYDYSILTIADYTDNKNAGVKLSLKLQVPDPTNLCTLDENFNDEPYIEPEENEITVEERKDGDITINPIKLPRNRC